MEYQIVAYHVPMEPFDCLEYELRAMKCARSASPLMAAIGNAYFSVLVNNEDDCGERWQTEGVETWAWQSPETAIHVSKFSIQSRGHDCPMDTSLDYSRGQQGDKC
jgi:hypothetical protein